MSESAFTWVREFFASTKKDGKRTGVWVPALLLLALALLLLSFATCREEKVYVSVQSEEAEALMAWREEEEKKLEEMLCRLAGIEKCYVSLNFSMGEESVREGGVTVSFSPARVGAVVVIYEGAPSLALKEKVVDMVTTLYGIGSNRVSVNPS